MKYLFILLFLVSCNRPEDPTHKDLPQFESVAKTESRNYELRKYEDDNTTCYVIEDPDSMAMSCVRNNI